MIWLTLALALREVRRNVLRSFLTTLGIVIGVGAVITMVTIGNGATAKVTSEVSSLGENVLFISPGADRRSMGTTAAKPFDAADVEAIRREVIGLEAVAGSVGSQVVAVSGNDNWSTSVTGADNDYLLARGLSVERGRPFSNPEIGGGAPVCLIGVTVARELFGSADPLGERIRVNRVSCLVVGLLESKGQSTFGSDQDDVILMPLRAVQRRIIGDVTISSIQVKAREGIQTAALQRQIELLLRERRGIQPGQKDDFRVRDVQELADAMSSITTALTGLLGGIAAVSLLVGGIGIMNIMLVSVTERTREIGTRLAIGALAGEVLLQFLVEAVVLSTLGGALGILFGLGLSFAGCRLLALPFVVSPLVVIGAFAFSAVVGVAFGFLPARKAARLNPIEALRHE